MDQWPGKTGPSRLLLGIKDILPQIPCVPVDHTEYSTAVRLVPSELPRPGLVTKYPWAWCFRDAWFVPIEVINDAVHMARVLPHAPRLYGSPIVVQLPISVTIPPNSDQVQYLCHERCFLVQRHATTHH